MVLSNWFTSASRLNRLLLGCLCSALIHERDKCDKSYFPPTDFGAVGRQRMF